MSKVFVLLVTLLALSAAPSPVYGASSAPCHEDTSCWNWATMGDRTRGVRLTTGARVPARYVRAVYASPTGTRAVVGPCAFARMLRAGMIYYPRTERMRGDHTAIVNARGGCRR